MTYLNKEYLKGCKTEISVLESYLEDKSNFHAVGVISQNDKYRYLFDNFGNESEVDLNHYNEFLFVKHKSMLSDEQKKNLQFIDSLHTNTNIIDEDEAFKSSKYKKYYRYYCFDAIQTILIIDLINFYNKDSGFSRMDPGNTSIFFTKFLLRNIDDIEVDKIKDPKLKIYVQNAGVIS